MGKSTLPVDARSPPAVADRPVFTDRRWMRRQFQALALERSGSSAPRFARARWEVQSSITAVDVALSHLPFPAPHLRTNAFMLDASYYVA